MNTYSFSIVSDTGSSLLNNTKLSNEIGASSIGQTPLDVASSGDVLKISFNSALDASQQAVLLAVINAHDGNPDSEEVIPTPVDIVTEIPPNPFANKLIGEKKLYSRVTGKAFPVTAGQTTELIFSIPYPHVKINGTEIMGCQLGDKLNFKVLDTTTGTYFGFPNLELNTFGVDVYMPDGKYERLSNYDADLYYGMQIKVEYQSQTDKTVYINYIIHELKD